MKKTLLAAACVLLVTAGAANAEEHVIEMLNKGEKGTMVFVPDRIRAAPGDTLRFVAADKGHNAETIKGMVPEGASGFKGKINEEVTVVLEKEGVYGIKCAPHYGMGMVALVIVGEPVNMGDAARVKHPGKAGKVFASLFEQAVASN
ncbi:pseudoazurin [Chelativorans intermedius]|uniref:Pseudoazurin n=1 Tax=Chelativorans intermedius TaxID=515947 RepID=A0ABV6D4H8_9HYPH|nr:pseudoazurin [Chelativorans intermedius]MCT8997560.1 pseudoazurin [Chelativorans intermedius]